MNRARWIFGLIAAAALAATSPVAAETAREVATRIDSLMQASWDDAGIPPSPLASDAEFLRRATLDLVGTIPSAASVRDFLDDKAPLKRQHAIDNLLASPRHATHLANTWRRMLLPDGFPNERAADAIGMQAWLRERFAENTRYDRLVGDFITASGNSETGPVLFYQALEVKPEKLAASTARIFLGLQLQCAQCHDHPFDDWSQHDFWEYAAFFARVNGNNQMNANQFVLRDTDFGEVTLPDESDPIQPAYPGKNQSAPPSQGSRRLQLSIWLASANNPYLAKATANRVWWLLFGRGLVEPVDDLSPTNAASHPQVLDLLAEFFVASDYDLRELIRAVAYTQAYGLSSRARGKTEIPPDQFAIMSVKNLTAEQLFDSLVQGIHNNDKLTADGTPAVSLANASRQDFLANMGSEAHRPLEYSSGLQQTLLLMNSREINDLLSDPQHGLLAALNAPFLDNRSRVESLLLSLLSRFPEPAEQTQFVDYLDTAGGDAQQRAARMSDIVWALVNSAEFRLNH